jgi:transcriptional regulator with XRE-family HTH domain
LPTQLLFGGMTTMAYGDQPGPPPGYDKATWKALEVPRDGAGDYVLLAPDGQLWISHPEDEFYWRHWDIYLNELKVGRYPSACYKPGCLKPAGALKEDGDAGFSVESYEPHKSIRQRREQLRFSQEEVASAIRIGLPAYRDLEDEDADAYFSVRLGALRRLCAFLGLDLLEVLGYACAFCGSRSDALPPDIVRTPGEVVHLRREELGLTHEALEQRLDWKPGLLQRLEQEPAFLEGDEPGSPTVSNLQELAGVLETPVQLVLGATCRRCMNRGIWRNTDPSRYEAILDTILSAFDLSQPVGRKQAYQECLRYADQRWSGTRDHNPFTWTAAERLRQDRIVVDVFRRHVPEGGDEALRLSWEEGTGPVLAGNRAGLRYLHGLLGRIADHATPGEHVHLRDEDGLWRGCSFPLTLSLLDEERFAAEESEDGETEEEDAEDGERGGQPQRREIEPRKIAALMVLYEHILPEMLLTPGKLYRVLDCHRFSEGERVWRCGMRDEIDRTYVFHFRWDDGKKTEVAFDLDDPNVLFLTKEALEQVR